MAFPAERPRVWAASILRWLIARSVVLGEEVSDRRTLLILSACITVFIISTFAHTSNPPRYDFQGFYASGQLALMSPHTVYQEEAQRDSQFFIYPKYFPFLHLPHELFVFAPLSLLSLPVALNLWRLLNLFAAIYACRALAKTFAASAWDLILIVVSIFSTFICLWTGQDDFVVLALIVGSLAAFLRGHENLSGILLAVSLFKPQFGIIIALAMFANRRWKFATAFAATSLCLVALCLAVFGPNVYFDLLAIIRHSQSPAYEIDMAVQRWTYPTISGLTYLLGMSHEIAAIASLAVVAWMLRAWRRTTDVRMLFASAIVTSILAAFNLHDYDLILLLIPMAALLNGSRLHFAAVYMLSAPLVFVSLLIPPALPVLCLPVGLMLFLVKRTAEGSKSRSESDKYLQSRGRWLPES